MPAYAHRAMRYVLHRRLTNLTVRRRGRINTAHTRIAASPAGQPIETVATIAPAKKPRSIEFSNEARAELVAKYRDFGYPVLTGRVNRCATLDVHRDGEHAGYVDDPSGIGWVIQTPDPPP